MAEIPGLGARKWSLAAVAILGLLALVIWGGTRPAPDLGDTGSGAITTDTLAAAPSTVADSATPDPETAEPRIPDALAPDEIDTTAPSFDLVRIDPDGSALIAGRAEPEENVDVLLDDVPLAMGQADQSGAFVTLTLIAPSDEPRVLALSTLRDGAPVRSAQTVIVAPSAPSSITASTTPPAAVASDQGGDAGADPASGIEVATATPTPATTGEPEPGQPTILVADDDGVRVLQSAGRPLAADRLSIDTISYDGDGDVVLAGRADSEATSVQIYLDNRPLTTAPMAGGGDWRAALPTLAPKVYTLRVDALDAEGRVTSRAETPFRPENPADVEGLGTGEDAGEGVSLITVQPGNSLWRIASDAYGEGLLYVRVFEANAEKIRDPDLIYPGQIFALPEDPQASEP